jgi:hypothetical protein
MLLLGKIALYIVALTAILAMAVPIICIGDFLIRNISYLSEAVVDKLSQIFKRKHKK